MRYTSTFMLAAVLACAAPASAQTIPAASAAKSKADASVLKYMIADSVGEIQLCRLALQKTQSDAVRTFANRMIADHTTNLTTAVSLAKALPVADLTMKPSDEAQIAYAHLSRYSGHDFDEEFIMQNEDDHRNDIEVVRQAKEVAGSANVRAFEVATLPVLEEHLRLAQATHDRIAHTPQS